MCVCVCVCVCVCFVVVVVVVIVVVFVCLFVSGPTAVTCSNSMVRHSLWFWRSGLDDSCVSSECRQ